MNVFIFQIYIRDKHIHGYQEFSTLFDSQPTHMYIVLYMVLNA